MMNTQIVQNQKDFTPGIPGQAGHELDQKLGIHGIPCPQGKGKFQLVRRLVNQGSLHLPLLFGGKGALLSRTAPTSAKLDGLAS